MEEETEASSAAKNLRILTISYVKKKLWLESCDSWPSYESALSSIAKSPRELGRTALGTVGNLCYSRPWHLEQNHEFIFSMKKLHHGRQPLGWAPQDAERVCLLSLGSCCWSSLYRCTTVLFVLVVIVITRHTLL